jgi:predicted  nucleic acid-binding Zn-ribbon protein
MASLGKKILSAFVELDNSEPPVTKPAAQPQSAFQAPVRQAAIPATPDGGNKFSEHFNRLFAEANLPGPDYYEFFKMTEAMQVIADEKARFCAAFAGLQVQGLDKQKLLSSAQEYIRILEADAAAFHNTIDAALLEKVQSRKKEMEEAQQRIQQLSQEIVHLQQQLSILTQEIAENETKIEHSTAGYAAALADRRNQLLQDIEKIKQHIL